MPTDMKYFTLRVARFLRDSANLTMRIGGLTSDVDWAASGTKSAGNNLRIVTGTSTTVLVKAGTIWTGTEALTLASDVTLTVGVELVDAFTNHVYAVKSGSAIVVQTNTTGTPPANTVKEAGIVMVAGNKVTQFLYKPEMVNELMSAVPTITEIDYVGNGTPSQEPTKALLVTAQFDITGTIKVGEFSLTTSTVLDHQRMSSPSRFIVAYQPLVSQVTVTDALLTASWKIIDSSPLT